MMKNRYMKTEAVRDREPALAAACSSTVKRAAAYGEAQALPESGRKDYIASFHAIFRYTKNREV